MNKVQDFKAHDLPQLRTDINTFIDNGNYKLIDVKYQLSHYGTHYALVIYDMTYEAPDKPFDPNEDINP